MERYLEYVAIKGVFPPFVLYEKCMNCEIEQHAELFPYVKALYNTCWDDWSKLLCGDKSVMCYSKFTFTLYATFSPPLVETDLRTYNDFPLVSIESKWLHLGHLPITQMCLKMIVDTLFGLEWATMSTVLGEERTPECIKQHYEMYELVKSRIFHLMNRDDLSKNILNNDKYTIIKKRGLVEKVDNSDINYDSKF